MWRNSGIPDAEIVSGSWWRFDKVSKRRNGFFFVGRLRRWPFLQMFWSFQIIWTHGSVTCPLSSHQSFASFFLFFFREDFILPKGKFPHPFGLAFSIHATMSRVDNAPGGVIKTHWQTSSQSAHYLMYTRRDNLLDTPHLNAVILHHFPLHLCSTLQEPGEMTDPAYSQPILQKPPNKSCSSNNANWGYEPAPPAAFPKQINRSNDLCMQVSSTLQQWHGCTIIINNK